MAEEKQVPGSSEQSKIEDELHAINEELKALKEKLSAAEKEERKEVSEETMKKISDTASDIAETTTDALHKAIKVLKMVAVGAYDGAVKALEEEKIIEKSKGGTEKPEEKQP